MKNNELTKKEQLVFDYLVRSINENGYAPSVRDIVASLGIKSTSSVHLYLHNLEEKGYIEQDPGKKRTIRLCAPFARSGNRVPILGAITAGLPTLAVENFEGYVELPWNNAKYSSDDLFALKVRGESMIEAGIFDKDLILVRQQNTANNGDIVVALIDGEETTVKRYFRELRSVRLQPENDKYQPIVGSDNIQVLGKVISVFRML